MHGPFYHIAWHMHPLTTTSCSHAASYSLHAVSSLAWCLVLDEMYTLHAASESKSLANRSIDESQFNSLHMHPTHWSCCTRGKLLAVHVQLNTIISCRPFYHPALDHELHHTKCDQNWKVDSFAISSMQQTHEVGQKNLFWERYKINSLHR